MSRRISKEELKSKDAFLSFSERASAYLADWIGPIVFVAGAALFSALAVIGYNYFQDQREKQAAEEIFPLQAAVIEKRQALQEAAADKEDSIDWKDGVDFASEFSSLTQPLIEVLSRHPGRNSAIMSSMTLANLMAEFELWSEAKEVLSVHKSKTASRKDPLAGLLVAQLAAVYANLSHWPQAVELYEGLLKSKNASFLHPEVMLRLGLIFEQMGERQRSENMLHQLAAEYGETEAGRSARGYLRLMQLSRQPDPSLGSEG